MSSTNGLLNSIDKSEKNLSKSLKSTSIDGQMKNGHCPKSNGQTAGRHFLGFGTTAIQTGLTPDRWDMNQLAPPISLSTTYKQPKAGYPIGHDYARDGNPTRDVLEEVLAALEQGKFCHIFSSGMSATAALANWLSTGDHIILADDAYGGTQRYFQTVCQEKHGIQLDFVDMTNLDSLQRAFKTNTKMVMFESPSNPMLKVIDIQAVVQISKAYDPNILVVVDNTFMTPFFQRPLELGADVVVESLTKYINGHTDVLMGAVITNNKQLDEHLLFQQQTVGALPSPFDTYLVIRGAKTLHLRMQRHMENALAIAKWLEADTRVEKVIYPELESHPQHHIHKKQTSGMSGMISFYIKGGLEEAEEFLSNLKVFWLAPSLGGFESLAELPAPMTHVSVPVEIRQQLGITDNLIRLSVGCEDKRDLLNDLNQALKAVHSLNKNNG